MIDLLSPYPYVESYQGEFELSDALFDWLAWDRAFGSDMSPQYPFGI
jgi:hypothetical protein